MPSGKDAIRPEKVTLAVKLLFGVIGIGIIQVVMLVFRHIDVRSPELLIFTKVTIYAFSIFLLYQIAAGRSWARLTLVAVFIIAVPLVVLPIFQSFSHYPVYSILEAAQISLYLAALGLLFHKSSSSWFDKM